MGIPTVWIGLARSVGLLPTVWIGLAWSLDFTSHRLARFLLRLYFRGQDFRLRHSFLVFWARCSSFLVSYFFLSLLSHREGGGGGEC